MATTTRTARKSATPRKAAQPKAAPAKTPAKPKAKPEPKVKKSDIPEEERDWTYLAEKDPTDLHEDFAAWLEEATGQEIDLKTVQAVCVLRMVYQRSDRNKARGTYRALAPEVVEQRSAHMIQAHLDAKQVTDRQKAEAEAKKAKAAAARKARSTTKKAAPAKKATA